MKRTMFCIAGLAMLALLLPSCAYLQTHKNIKEIGAEYEGYTLDPPTAVYRKGSQWYISVQQRKMQKRYPVLHDNIMFTDQNQEPRFEALQPASTGDNKTVYVPVSSDTALVLQKSDGYFTQNVLLQELQHNISQCQVTLSDKSAHPVRATIQGGQSSFSLESTRTPQHPSTGLTVLSWVDRVVIDWPGTIAYNVCIPFMAPFFFFSDFLSDN